MTIKTLTTAAALAVTAGMAFADGHAAGKTIVENAVDSPVHTTLVAAVTQADLVETLSGAGPFTVFAPTDDAFGMITDETLGALLMDENKAQLVQILTCHVIGAEVFSEALAGMISDGGGAFTVETLGGCMLNAEMDGGSITLTDENGRAATVAAADVASSNGVIHVIDRVILPKQ